MADWYVDKGLKTLINQVKERFPGIVVYTIGDLEHKERVSDHNPEDDGSVDAADFMIGPHFSKADAEWLFNRLIVGKDPRFYYVIYNRRIYSSVTRPGVLRTFEGNPHTDHVHLSVNDKHENDGSEWKLAEKTRVKSLDLDGFKLPVLKYGEDDHQYDGWNLVGRVQKMLGVSVDGIYGPATAKAVRDYMGGGDGRLVDGEVWVKLYGLTRG